MASPASIDEAPGRTRPPAIGWATQAVIVGVAGMLTVGAILLYRAAGSFETSVRRQQAEALASHVGTTNRAIDLWYATQERFVANIAAKPEVVGLTRRILQETPSPGVLARSPVLAEIREVLQQEIDVVDGRGIFILGPGNVSYASLRDANLGRENFLVHEHPVQIREAWGGEIVAIPPVRSDVPLSGVVDPGSDRSLFLAAPIRGADGETLAVLTVRYDARETIDRILSDGERGYGFDSYAFDEGARFVTEPRDASGRLRASLPRGHALWYLDASVVTPADPRDAAAVEPTLLASAAIAGGRGMEPGGYANYDGERVIGAWAWNAKLNLGLAAEVDEARALLAFGRVYRSIQLLAVSVTALSLGLVASSLVYRRVNRHQARALRLDPMSGIACRGFFDTRLAAVHRDALRSGSPLSLILLDIDHFKAFNDLYGHPAGDACIRTIAGCLQGSCRRPTDLAARYGGEEFAVLLPMTDAAGAARVAAKIQEAVRRCGVPHAGSRAADVVTASIGVVTADPSDRFSGPAELVDLADRNLYRAKNTGRNGIVAGEAAGAKIQRPPLVLRRAA